MKQDIPGTIMFDGVQAQRRIPLARTKEAPAHNSSGALNSVRRFLLLCDKQRRNLAAGPSGGIALHVV